jgi:hypothetical protein
VGDSYVLVVVATGVDWLVPRGAVVLVLPTGTLK